MGSERLPAHVDEPLARRFAQVFAVQPDIYPPASWSGERDRNGGGCRSPRELSSPANDVGGVPAEENAAAAGAFRRALHLWVSPAARPTSESFEGATERASFRGSAEHSRFDDASRIQG